MTSTKQTARTSSSPRPSTGKSNQPSLAQRAISAPRTALRPLVKVEERIVSELSRGARATRKRIGL
jgi:hypothetical protein